MNATDADSYTVCEEQGYVSTKVALENGESWPLVFDRAVTDHGLHKDASHMWDKFDAREWRAHCCCGPHAAVNYSYAFMAGVIQCGRDTVPAEAFE